MIRMTSSTSAKTSGIAAVRLFSENRLLIMFDSGRR
jgi:hypothetical protein